MFKLSILAAPHSFFTKHSKGNEETHSTTRSYFGPTKYSLAKIDVPRFFKFL